MLCQSDDKRFLLANYPDVNSILNTNAYELDDLAAEMRVQINMPNKSRTELVVEQLYPRDEPVQKPVPYNTSIRQ